MARGRAGGFHGRLAPPPAADMRVAPRLTLFSSLFTLLLLLLLLLLRDDPETPLYRGGDASAALGGSIWLSFPREPTREGSVARERGGRECNAM